MIGYYVHHHGRGHVHRALALRGRLAATGSERVTVLSSVPPPPGSGDWVRLPLDTGGDDEIEATAGGTLHWAPLDHAGLRNRMAAVSAWIASARPRLMICDVSQEVALLCRLHGVPVASVVVPGRRVDPAHQLGLRLSSALWGFWPALATDLLPGLPDDLARLVQPLGALSRFDVVERAPRRADPRPRSRRVAVLGGAGGPAWTAEEVEELRRSSGSWQVEAVGGDGVWLDDPWPVLRRADVVIVHAGQNAVAEVAAARVPAIVVPAERPFGEQVVTAAQLDSGPWPAVALPRLRHPDWPRLLDATARLDGHGWASWCDGRAAERFADAVRVLASRTPRTGASATAVG